MNLLIDKNIISTKILLKKEDKAFAFKYTLFDEENLIGNVYLGRVRNITTSMKALFVDIGLEKNAYLDFNDLLYSETFRKNYHVGQEIIVQVKKNPTGDKGAKISEKISISNKNLVLLPYDKKIYISKKINGARLKYDLKEDFESITDEVGLIVRTNAKDKPFNQLKKEYEALHNQWKEIERQKIIRSDDTLLYKANNEYDSSIEDYFSEIENISVNSKEIYNELLAKYSSKIKIIHEKKLSLKTDFINFVNQNINLDNGIHLNIEQTEALTVIDVNSGKYISSKDLNGVYNVNSIALKEIARQLNLKSINGIILIDLINFQNSALEKKLENELKKWLNIYKNKFNIFGFTKTGLLELTKQYTNKDLLTMVTNNSKNIINNHYLNEKYYSDILISEIKNVLNNTNSRKIGIYCNEETIEYMKNEKFIQEYFVKSNLTVVYNISSNLKIKHLPFKKEV